MAEGVWVAEVGREAAMSFEDYVAARSPALLRFARLVTGHEEDAHDVVQDALVGAYPRWSQISSRGAVEAYLRRSIVNANVSRWRKVRRLVVTEDFPTAAVEDASAALADADQAARLCADLPAVQRAAVVLRYYEDRSFADIAEILGCREATARSHVHRALAALRSRLEADHD